MEASGRLPVGVRHGYGVAALSLAIGNTAIIFFLLKYLTDEAGLSGFEAGLVVFVGKIYDAVVDPFAGWLSDRTRTSWGARRPWILGGSAPFALLFAALWWGLPVSGVWATVIYAVLFIAYSTAYTAVVVPYGALTPALTDDYDERTRLNASRMAWSMIGGLFCAIVASAFAEGMGFWRITGLALGASPPAW